jgi:hypothetical protein
VGFARFPVAVNVVHQALPGNLRPSLKDQVE